LILLDLCEGCADLYGSLAAADVVGLSQRGRNGGRDAPVPDRYAIARARANDLVNHGEKIFLVERFRQMRGKAGSQTALDIIPVDTSGDGNCRNFPALPVLDQARAQTWQELQSAAVRKGEITDQQIERLALSGSPPPELRSAHD
jgi:hypothetical protein